VEIGVLARLDSLDDLLISSTALAGVLGAASR
jgi:hypothetical protein